MLDAKTIEAIADELLEAGRSRTPVPRLTSRYTDMTVEDSYAVQQLWRRRNEEAGRTLVGRKIGLTSRAMQAATGITEPDYGAIFDDMVLETGLKQPEAIGLYESAGYVPVVRFGYYKDSATARYYGKSLTAVPA